jgi:hypothetical protein
VLVLNHITFFRMFRAGGVVRKKLIVAIVVILAIGVVMLPGCKKSKRSGFTAQAEPQSARSAF